MINGHPFLTRESLVALAEKPEIKELFVPELSGSIRLRLASLEVFLQLPGKDLRQGTELLVGYCLVDEAGIPLFTAENIQKFFELPMNVGRSIINAINEMNGWTPTQHEELEKNSQTLDGDLASSSPESLG